MLSSSFALARAGVRSSGSLLGLSRFISTAKADAKPIDTKAKPQGQIQGRSPSYSLSSTGEVVIQVAPLERINESQANQIKRLIYQSRKRGILETDLLLSRFADKFLHKLTKDELNQYDKLLDELDWDIYYWITKNKDYPVPQKWQDSSILKLLQEECAKTEGILRMPELKANK